MSIPQENALTDAHARFDVDPEQVPPSAQLRAVVLALAEEPAVPAPRVRHGRLWQVLAAVAVVQLVWLAWQRWPESVRSPPLLVTLERLETEALEPRPAPEPAPEPYRLPEPVPETAEEATAAEVPEEALVAPAKTPAPRPHARVMIENAREWLQTKELPEAPASARSFSTADLALGASEGDDDGSRWRRPRAICQYARVPGVIRYKDKRGYTTPRKIDAWGSITCVQERGFAGDANPPLWYIVPYC